MAFALGFAGGFADTAVQPEPEPEPIVGRGSGAPLVRTRWIPRPRQPPLPPVRIAVAVHVGYRLDVAVTTVAPQVRLTLDPPHLSVRVATVTMWLRTGGFAATTAAKVVKVDVDPVAVSRFAYEVRELTEIAVALTAWQQ